MKPEALIFDLDGTLVSNKFWVDVGQDNWNWKTFAKEAAVREPNKFMKELWQRHEDMERIILTARPQFLRQITYIWLKQKLDFKPDTDMLLMMPNEHVKQQEVLKDEDVAPFQAGWKISELERLQKSFKIVGVFEDNPAITTLYKEKKLNVLEVTLSE